MCRLSPFLLWGPESRIFQKSVVENRGGAVQCSAVQCSAVQFRDKIAHDLVDNQNQRNHSTMTQSQVDAFPSHLVSVFDGNQLEVELGKVIFDVIQGLERSPYVHQILNRHIQQLHLSAENGIS